MTLADLQRQFQADMIAPVEPAATLLPAAARRGLPVYRHAYRATLRAALADSYERTHAWLGDDLFDAAAAAHRAGSPPAGWTLGDYGEDFAATLARLHPDDPEIVELAWLDWSLRRAFDAPDTAPLDPATLAEIDWDRARLTLHPSLRLRPIATNSPAIWSAIAAGDTPPPVAPAADEPWLRVWRQGLAPTFRTIDAGEALALAAALRGETFGALCAGLDADPDVAAARGGALLGSWIADGVVVGIG